MRWSPPEPPESVKTNADACIRSEYRYPIGSVRQTHGDFQRIHEADLSEPSEFVDALEDEMGVPCHIQDTEMMLLS